MTECEPCRECYWWSMGGEVCAYPVPDEKMFTSIDEDFYEILIDMVKEYAEHLERIPLKYGRYWRWKNSTIK